MNAQLYDHDETCELLIIGSEGAGGPAAIAATLEGVDVLIASKGKMGRCGASQMAGADFNVDGASALQLGFPGDDRDSPERFLGDIVREGQYLNDQRVVEKYVEYARKSTSDLLEWGMPVYRFEQIHAEEMARGLISSGVKWVQAIRRKARELGIRVMSDTMVVDLLTREGRVIGALAVDLKSGEIVLIRAKAVVLATGGWQQAYYFNSAAADLTGDGQAMAFRAGAELIAMEMVQYIPMAVLWPPLERKSIMPYIMSQTEAGPLIHLLNARGERFMEFYDASLMEQSTKGVVAIASELEASAGRGSSHGGVYFSLKHLTGAGIDFLWGKFKEFIDENSDNRYEFRALLPQLLERAKTEDIEVGNAVHFMCGGIKVSELAETSLPGLYAAGECSGGLWGAARVASATTQVGAQGRLAGEQASLYLRQVEHLEPEHEQLEKFCEKIIAPLEGGGTAPFEAQRRMYEITARAMGVIRDGPSLTEAYEEIKAMGAVVGDLKVSASRGRRLNPEWQLCMEMRNMLLCLELSSLASLTRKESRGEFYRSDFTGTDNDGWCRNIVFANRDGTPEMMFQGPVVTTVQPPTGTMSFTEALGAATASLKQRGEGL